MERETVLRDPRSLRGYAHPLRLRLIGLLRSDGPITATEAAARLDDNVPNCSFHLRQLAKYGLAERAPAADGRERPWRATSQQTSWDDDSDDPAMKLAADQLNSGLLDVYTQRAREYLTARGDEPVEWRVAAGFDDVRLYVTAAELRELSAQIDALLARYADAERRSTGARPVQLIRMAVPRGPVP
jgi:hypothetical protein